jgi:hypothetical protein
MRHRPVGLALAVTLAVLLALGPGHRPAAAQTLPSSTTVNPEATGILPQPNSGTPAQDAGDRGGWAQGLVFAMTMGGVALVVVLVVRSSRRARAGVSPPGAPPSSPA